MIVWAEILCISEHLPEGRENTLTALPDISSYNLYYGWYLGELKDNDDWSDIPMLLQNDGYSVMER